MDLAYAIIDDRDAGIFRVNRTAMISPDVLADERKRIFDKAWLYVGHESEIPNPGDYRRRMIANRPLFIIRGKDGDVRVLANTCTHRGAMVCRRDEGNAETFVCFYHGWVFNSQGELVGVPGADAYAEGFDRSERALASPARVESYRGFFFVSFNPDVESLPQYLGAAREIMDLTIDGGDMLGGWQVIRGTARYTIHANWKLLVENSMDGYHLPTVHQTYIDYMTERRAKAGAGRMRVEQKPTISQGFALRNGHVGMLSNTPGRPIASPSAVWPESAIKKVQAIREQLNARYGEHRGGLMADVSRHLIIFPNVAFQDSHTGFRMRQWWPVSPGEMEITQWELVPRHEDPELRAYRMEGSLAFLGPGGFATPDDVEALESCQVGFHAREVEYSDVSRGMHDMNPESTDEIQMRGFWRAWHARMEGRPMPSDEEMTDSPNAAPVLGLAAA